MKRFTTDDIVSMCDVDRAPDDTALTLPAQCVSDEKQLKEALMDDPDAYELGPFTKEHGGEDGWKISGVVKHDWFVWVNDFVAEHPEYGRVSGDFEEEIHADSDVAVRHLLMYHCPISWSYEEI